VAPPLADPAVQEEWTRPRHRADEVVPFARKGVELRLRGERRELDRARRDYHRPDYSPGRNGFFGLAAQPARSASTAPSIRTVKLLSPLPTPRHLHYMGAGLAG